MMVLSFSMTCLLLLAAVKVCSLLPPCLLWNAYSLGASFQVFLKTFLTMRPTIHKRDLDPLGTQFNLRGLKEHWLWQEDLICILKSRNGRKIFVDSGKGFSPLLPSPSLPSPPLSFLFQRCMIDSSLRPFRRCQLCCWSTDLILSPGWGCNKAYKRTWECLCFFFFNNLTASNLTV